MDPQQPSPLNGGQIPPPPQSSKSHRGVWLIVALVVVLVAALVVAAVKKSKKSTAPQPQPQTQAKQNPEPPPRPVTRKDLTIEQAKTALPADWPWETGSQISQSKEFTDAGTGKTLVNVVYASVKTLADNSTLFKNYLIQGGWSITANKADTNSASIDANKADSLLSILINKDKQGNVSINVSYQP
ncbi:MAG: hypothetical protein KGJ93_04780 [Patescibacteria group bacterium]|nr:hypothetical protein [Patescibacteria group bacterium]